MTSPKQPIEIYLAHLGKIVVVHGTSTKEGAVAKRLADCLTDLGIKETELLPVSVKELSGVVKQSGHVILVFNSMDNLARKLRHGTEFTTEVSRMRQNQLAVVCKGAPIPSSSPLNYFMRFNFDEDVHQLAKKCVTVFGAPKPVAGETDAVLWHDYPLRVVLQRVDSSSSLGLSIITRQLHSSDSPLKRVTLVKEINREGVASSHPMLKKYMHLQSINGVSLDNRDVPEAANIIQETVDNEVQLMVRVARRDVEKAERLRRQPSNQIRAADSPMDIQRGEEFSLVGKSAHERVVSTPKLSTMSADFGGSFSSDSSGTPVEEVFRRKPTDLHCATNGGCITGVRQRGDKVYDEFKWEKQSKEDILTGGEGCLGLSLTLVDLAVNEDHNQGVMIKDFQPGCHSVYQLLQVNDLIYSVEGIPLMNLSIAKAKQVLEQSRGRNTEVKVLFHHMINVNLEIDQSRAKRLLPQGDTIGRSDEGVCVEKYPFLPATGNHYHNVLVLGDAHYSREMMGILCSEVKGMPTEDLDHSNSLLMQRYLDDGWEPVERKANDDSLNSLDCEYVVTMINHHIVDMQFPPMNLLQHIFLKPSGVTLLVVALDSFLDDPYSEYGKMQSMLALIHTHACPKGTHVIVVGVYKDISKAEATRVAGVITEVVKSSPATNGLVVDCDQRSVVFMYQSGSADHRNIKSHLQLVIKDCINAYYKRLEHTSQHFIPRQWPVVRQVMLQMSLERSIFPLKDLDQPIKEHCSMESNGHPYVNLLKILQEYSPAVFFAPMDSEPQRDFLCDPTVVPRILVQTLPKAVDKHSQFCKNDLELFTSSLIITTTHLRRAIMEEMKEEMKDTPFDALLAWMTKLLLAYRITVDNRVEGAALQQSKSEYIFFPFLGQFTSKPILRKELQGEFQNGIWELYVHIGEPISAAFYYKFLALLIQGAFECVPSADRVNCFRISSNGQLATVCFHAKSSPMHFRLMVEFHELQRVIEIKMKQQTHFQFSRFSSFVTEILQEICSDSHWVHLKRSIMMGHKPSTNESVFTPIIQKLKSLCQHEVAQPTVYQIEMSPVFEHNDAYNMLSPQSNNIGAIEEAKQYIYGKKMDYPTFKVVSEILDSSGKWDMFAHSLNLAGVFELSRMQRYSMMSHGIEVLSRALGQYSIEEITTTLRQLELNLAVDIIEKRANPTDLL